MLERRRKDAFIFYASPLLEAIGVPHAFSTRLGGVSDGVFSSLNLGNPTGVEIQDSSDRIAQNYRLLQNAIGCAERSRCFVHQIHGGDVRSARRDQHFENGCAGDAIVSDDPNRLIAVRIADCVPILVSTRDGRKVAAIHAGWRGIVAGVITNALESFDQSDVVAAIGPCISFDAFEVGEEVLRAFGQKTVGKGHVDLREAAKRQLVEAGVLPASIDTTDRCTFRDADEFFSHRRERGVTGRMAAVIGAVDPR